MKMLEYFLKMTLNVKISLHLKCQDCLATSTFKSQVTFKTVKMCLNCIGHAYTHIHILGKALKKMGNLGFNPKLVSPPPPS